MAFFFPSGSGYIISYMISLLSFSQCQQSSSPMNSMMLYQFINFSFVLLLSVVWAFLMNVVNFVWCINISPMMLNDVMSNLFSLLCIDPLSLSLSLSLSLKKICLLGT